LLLVYATWNPLGKSFVHWVILPLVGRGGDAAASAPVKLLLAILLVIGWTIFLQATRRALGLAGAVLIAALCGAIIWLLTSWKVLALRGDAIAHAVLVSVAILLTVGMSWSHLSRRLTGQIDADTVG
jgi:multidrug transporter EmrE-like cation transporter